MKTDKIFIYIYFKVYKIVKLILKNIKQEQSSRFINATMQGKFKVRLFKYIQKSPDVFYQNF